MNTTESYSHNKCKPPKQHNWGKSHNIISSSLETQLNTRFNIFTCWSAPAHVKMSELCLEKWDAHIQHTSSTSCRFSKQLDFVFASEKKLGYISRKRNNPEACFWWKITRNGCSWGCVWGFPNMSSRRLFCQISASAWPHPLPFLEDAKHLF